MKLITTFTTELLSESGNDIRIEWELHSPFAVVFVNDCEVEVLGSGENPLVLSGVAILATQYLMGLEALYLDARGTDEIDDRREYDLDEAYADESFEEVNQ